MILKIEPDKQKAKSLKQMALITLERLRKTDLEKYPSNTLKDYYEIIMQLMKSLNYLNGVKIKGDKAHYETIEIICKRYNFKENLKIFLQDMRYLRNRISYEGFNIKVNYIKQNSKKIEDIIKKLVNLLDKKIL